MKASNKINVRESIIRINSVKEDIRILCAGDFHITSKTKEKDIDFYLESANEEKPDYICLLGDLIDTPYNIESCKELLFKLIKGSALIAPTFVIIGNHDFIHNKKDYLNKELWNEINDIKNVRLLNNKVYENKEITFMGYTQTRDAYYNTNRDIVNGSDSFYNDIIKHNELYDINNNLPKIALIHSPEFIIEKRTQELLNKYDVIICGHYHNGCVPPILDKMWNSNRGLINARKYLFPRNVRGITKLEHFYLVYNGGWTKLSESSGKKFSKLDSLFNRQIDVITITNNPEYEKIKIKQKYKKMKKIN